MRSFLELTSCCTFLILVVVKEGLSMKLHTLRSKLTLSYALIIAIPVAIIMVCMLTIISTYWNGRPKR